ncbi:POK9 protein, partial [Upupa epops]|nr:POK9 protein [Upupa epops]
GSLGLDLAAAVVTVTFLSSEVQKIPTGVGGPVLRINSKIGALLVGRSLTGTAGLIFFLPGVIDADYTGEIQVMAYALNPPIVVKAGTHIAQLLLQESVGNSSIPNQKHRGNQRFGSKGRNFVSLAQQMRQGPMISLSLSCNNKAYTITVVMDTGADVAII